MRSTTPRPATPAAITLLIAADRLVVREGLKRIVAQCPGLKVVGEAATREEVLERVQAGAPDVALLDCFLVGVQLLGLVREVRRRHPRCRVLVLDVQGQDAGALRILGTGAAGYLSPDYSRRQLIDAIRQVASGASYVSPSLAGTLLSGLGTGGARPRHTVLSDREYEVLCLFGSGLAFKDIAIRLGVSPKTVSTYRSRILEKLDLTSNVAIIRYAIEHGLAPAATPAPRRKNPTPRSGRG